MGDAAARTGSFPAVTTERPSPPPSPPHGSPEWHGWVEKRLASLDREVFHVRESAGHLADQIGRPPIPAAKDPGAGMWLVLADVRVDCTAILAKLDAADAASATRGGWAARVGWRALETVIPLGILALIGWAAGFHR